MVITQIKDAFIHNLEISREDILAQRNMRITFDIETPVGTFNYDSDWRRVGEIRQIMQRFGIHAYGELVYDKLPCVTLEISTDPGGDGH